MIKNDRQYQATLSQIEVLRSGLIRARQTKSSDAFTKAHIQSLETDIELLDEEAQDYRLLRSKSFDLTTLEVVDQLGADLVRARIAGNVTQKTLADAVGRQEQAIQRWEDNKYSGARLKILQEVAHALRTLVPGHRMPLADAAQQHRTLRLARQLAPMPLAANDKSPEIDLDSELSHEISFEDPGRQLIATVELRAFGRETKLKVRWKKGARVALTTEATGAKPELLSRARVWRELDLGTRTIDDDFVGRAFTIQPEDGA